MFMCITLMCDNEKVLVVDRFAAEVLAHKPLAVQDFVQLQILAIHHAG